MKILHVVSLVDPKGSFGGPLRVAVNQLRVLGATGHEVTLLAGARGFAGGVPEEFEGVPLRAFAAVRLIPGTGFAGLISPGLLRWLWAHAHEYDVVHVHLARDLVSLPAAAILRARRVSYVVQTHGMIDVSDRSLAKLLDSALTRRVLRSAQTVFALTSREVGDLDEVCRDLADVQVLHNGVPDTDVSAVPSASEEVLFLARIAKRKRPDSFIRAAQAVAKTHPTATFILVGPGEDALKDVEEELARDGAGGRIAYEGVLPPSETLLRMAKAAVYVLPAVNEPFGMTVFEAMSVGLPAVVRDDCGVADLVESAGGIVCGQSDEDLADAIRTLLDDPARRDEAGAQGLALVRRDASMTHIVETLVCAYGSARKSAR